MPRPQYAVILTDENVVEIVTAAEKQGWIITHLPARMKRLAHSGDRLILFMVLDESGCFAAFNDTPYRAHLHDKLRLSETITQLPTRMIEEG